MRRLWQPARINAARSLMPRAYGTTRRATNASRRFLGTSSAWVEAAAQGGSLSRFWASGQRGGRSLLLGAGQGSGVGRVDRWQRVGRAREHLLGHGWTVLGVH